MLPAKAKSRFLGKRCPSPMLFLTLPSPMATTLILKWLGPFEQCSMLKSIIKWVVIIKQKSTCNFGVGCYADLGSRQLKLLSFTCCFNYWKILFPGNKGRSEFDNEKFCLPAPLWFATWREDAWPKSSRHLKCLLNEWTITEQESGNTRTERFIQLPK